MNLQTKANKLKIVERIPISVVEYSNVSLMPPVALSYIEATNLLSVHASEGVLNLYRFKQGSLTCVGQYNEPSHGVILQGILTRDWQSDLARTEQANLLTLSLE